MARGEWVGCAAWDRGLGGGEVWACGIWAWSCGQRGVEGEIEIYGGLVMCSLTAWVVGVFIYLFWMYWGRGSLGESELCGKREGIGTQCSGSEYLLGGIEVEVEEPSLT